VSEHNGKRPSSDPNRWRDDTYPDYPHDVNRAIDFSGVQVDFFLEGKALHLQRLIAQRLSRREFVALDIGCGIGAMHPYLRNTFAWLHGVDVSADAVRDAGQRNPWVKYVTYDGRTLPFDSAAMDVVFASCVLHHVPKVQWPEFMQEAKRVLRPGGLCVVFEHNPFNPLTRLAVLRCEFDRDAALLRRGTAELLFKTAGFSQVEGQYIFVAPSRANWAQKAEKLLGDVPLGAQYYIAGART
jgi:SAM-dependent methyltransferase